MNRFLFLSRFIGEGQSVLRSYLNFRLSKERLKGKTIDIGGGKNASYLKFMKQDDVSFETFDLKAGNMVDFETDRLPAPDDEYDTVLFLNVMEHIYNYRNIASEVVRIVKPGGQLIGFVPFLMWYHPDHSDYFRYTNEALAKIFAEVGVTKIEIEPIAKGPFSAAAHMIILSFPKLLRVPVFALLYGMDSLFLRFRPTHGQRYVLGYFFKIHK